MGLTDSLGPVVAFDRGQPLYAHGNPTHAEWKASLKPQRKGGAVKKEMDRLMNFDFSADDGAYDDALNVAQERNAVDEQSAIDRVLGGFQGRGIARSGISLKDVVEKVLGPSILRSRELASSFGLEKLRNLQDQDRLKFGGIAGLGQARVAQNYAGEAALRAASAADDARKRARQGGLAGLLGGAVGGVAGGPLGATIGSGLSQLF